ncbi:unnamed protein product [Phytophthora lilii]|uniref:Unnamed protein product n=1 Tax=Phytophthora lilii TaxID=2077276 RepID=A0A9W6TEF5_9STRA|nr:unnamed protein product [Phytophthora lilii]
MSDRRRKRKTTNSFADDTVKDFHAVDPVQTRRRSDSSDHGSGIRHESWMSKVSIAMSTRIFSGGKKLSGSRSTQVMPISGVASDNTKRSAGRVSSSSISSSQEQETQQASCLTPHGDQHTLRLVASEKTLTTSTTDTPSPMTSFGECPSVTCDVAPDDSEGSHEDDQESRWSLNGSTFRRGDSRRRGNRREPSSAIVQKVRPGGDEDEDGDDEVTYHFSRVRVASIPSGTIRHREARDDTDGEVNVQDAAPILKEFFSKSVSVSKEQRQHQREQRREMVYRESKERQDKLREQTELERIASEESSRKQKVEQLRRLNQQRRLELLRDASSARKDLLERIQEENNKYMAERERWENDFEDEMRVLSDAFRKARTTDENRPMTVAGPAVPEAMSQLERDASNFEKRVKTAQPALASMPSRTRQSGRPSTSGSTPCGFDFNLSSPLFDTCEVLALEDSKEVIDIFGGEDQLNDLFPRQTNTSVETDRILHPDLDLDLDQLLGEREKLLLRVAAIDRMVQTQQL